MWREIRMRVAQAIVTAIFVLMSAGWASAQPVIIGEDLTSNRFNALPKGTLQVVVFYDGADTGTAELGINFGGTSWLWIDAIPKFDRGIATREILMIASPPPSGLFRVIGVEPDGGVDGLAFAVFWRDDDGNFHMLQSSDRSLMGKSNFVCSWPLGMTDAQFAERTPQITDPLARQTAKAMICGAKLLGDGSYKLEEATMTDDGLRELKLEAVSEGGGSGVIVADIGSLKPPHDTRCSTGGDGAPGRCSFLYPTNSIVTLRVVADELSTFTGWGGYCAGTTVETCTVILTDDQQVAGTFSAGAPPPDIAAVYDPTLKAPKCASVGRSCDSGTLLEGRDGKGPEPHQPNTINNSCADDTFGSYTVDESNERIKVSTVDGSIMAAGKAVRIEATVWPVQGFGNDRLDLYYADGAANPVWTFITTLTPTASVKHTLSATYTLPVGALQAVRARFRFLGQAFPCGSGVGGVADHDDLIFAVGSSAGPTKD